MKTLTKFLFIIGLIALTSNLVAQPWMQPRYLNPSQRLNFYEIQKAFNAYEKDHAELSTTGEVEEGEEEIQLPGYMQYKRWEWFMEQRVYPSGDITLPSRNMEEYQNFLRSGQQERQQSGPVAIQSLNGNWASLGPSSSAGSGNGRSNFIRFDPVNPSIMWTGAPAGGLWKSVNGGSTWTTNTDYLTVIGCSDVAINPLNTNIMYLATGDGDGYTTNSIGILKSLNGGITWDTTGLVWPVSDGHNLFKILINPVNPNIIIAGANDGIYRSTDEGTSWTHVNTTPPYYFTDLEFKPGNPNTVYAVSWYNFYKSTDGGATFTLISSGLPAIFSTLRLAIAVTPADSNYVYLVANSASASTFYGFYRSTDGGDNFTTQSTTPDIVGAQGSYDLAIAANPVNKNDVYVGGKLPYRSTEGGVNWTLISFSHADIHALEFFPGSSTTIFEGNDGGVYKSTANGSAFTNLNSGLAISQIYRLSTAATNPDFTVMGLQDNGTKLRNNGAWSNIYYGDGMDCQVDYTVTTTLYVSTQYGAIYKSINGGGSFSNMIYSNGTGVHASGNWINPFIIHPTDHNTLLVGKAQVYRSIDGGTNWAQVGNVSGFINSLAFAPSNRNYIYATRYNTVYVSTDSTTFINRTGTIPTSSGITSLAVSNTNHLKAWVTLSGYNAVNKVYYTNDAGITWTNYSTGLPNLPVNCIIYQNGSNDGLYVGTDVGIYYRNNTMSSWQPFSNGLPNVIVDDLDIQYASGKLRAATYGRGLWESDLYSTTTGINMNETDNDFSVYPNPTNGKLIIESVPGNQKPYDIIITNLLGEKVRKERNIISSREIIELSNETPGIYFIQVIVGDKCITKKILVTK